MEVFKTTAFMVILMLLFVSVGFYIGGTNGMIMAFLIASAMNFFSYFYSDKLILKHFNAMPVSQNSQIYLLVKELTSRANLPMPKVYIIDDNAPNAFATGRNHENAAVALTSGLINLMNENEIKAVVAHELGHIKHYDILTGSIAAVFAGALSLISNFAQLGTIKNENRPNMITTIALAVITPLVASIIQMSISRSREYEADRFSAITTQNPQWLIDALSKLENYSQNHAVLKNADPQTAHMFIINPFGNVKSNLSNLFRTHPTTSDRIQKLKQMTNQSPAARYFNSL
ncbi:M48 family peptidase [Campylobacter hyointestinalis]|uniref:zinc metalloprotease HtpX n=1 Tax=Campylobacter hyointestinalis TaxID=198 RepID=UPI0004D74671|nr:zinc metalloprotease HtpX [Campylobacter hyointestinalis]KEA44705.1 protease [Campylobacter hyointestinalis subsp. hyointestinalis]QKF56403.1 heat shock protein HtpX, M48 family peptidase [Campylobacter hyointestinalis subsp. hyointestinalis]TXK46571.1 zinc metalloprotease HtpX [Campylobacter hyointestinalis]SFT43632.1 Heat shock protein. Metallo peptidase. MEROPS family M48B [Campylobacter hyointestinalis]SUW91207.1 M48 family peptidase [Campylobacter hyointestinalis]